MRVLFAGTPAFSVAALDAIVDAGEEVVLVLTQPDRPSGRGMALGASPVKLAAERLGLPVAQPRTLREPEIQARLRDLAPDIMVVVAYGLILPQAVLDIPRHGAVNIHASLLPRWRGAAPIQRAIEAGDPETGITVMRMDAGLDTGPMLLRESTPIHDTDTAGTLHDRLQAMGARLIVNALAAIEGGSLVSVAQPEHGVTYARKLSREEAPVDWSLTATGICRRVRAFDPVPGASSTCQGVSWKLWGAQPIPEASGPSVPCGTIVRVSSEGVDVQAGSGIVRLTEMQKAGGRRLPVDQLLRGARFAPGDRFDPPPAGA